MIAETKKKKFTTGSHNKTRFSSVFGSMKKGALISIYRPTVPNGHERGKKAAILWDDGEMPQIRLHVQEGGAKGGGAPPLY